jgi:peptidoglycan hydrolase-like protein with peptidoglycan-binding domain
MFSQHHKHVIAVAILMVASYSLPQVKQALAVTNIDMATCPIGYICEPKVNTSYSTVVPKAEQSAPTAVQIIKAEQKYCYTFSNNLDPENLSGGVSIEKDSGVSLFNLQTILQDKENININNTERDVKNPKFGDSTKSAVIAFQKKYGIPAIGVVGPMTRSKLNKIYGCGNDNMLQNKVLPTASLNNINNNVGPQNKTLPVSEKAKYYANTNISNVKIVDSKTYSSLVDGSVITKGSVYRITWEATEVPESARFTIIFQSPTNPNVYGVMRTGLLDASKRYYDWKVEDTFIENINVRIIVQVGDVRAYSPLIKISSPVKVFDAGLDPSANPKTLEYKKTEAEKSPSSISLIPGIKSMYPVSGAPGTKVTLTLSNPKKEIVSYGDFNFGNFGLPNFTNTNNEVITFTVPNDAKAGVYEVVWFSSNDMYVTKFNVITQSAPVSHATGWNYVASVFDTVITLASIIM